MEVPSRKIFTRRYCLALGALLIAALVLANVGCLHSQSPGYPSENEIGPVAQGFVDALNHKNVGQALSYTVYEFADNETYRSMYGNIAAELLNGGANYSIVLSSVDVIHKSDMSEVQKEEIWGAIGAVEITKPVSVLDYCYAKMGLVSTYADATFDGFETWPCFQIKSEWFLVF